MRLKSASILLSVLLHAAHNTFFQRLFDPLTVYNPKTPYVAVAGEFGAALAVVSILIAVYLSLRRTEVEPYALRPSGEVPVPAKGERVKDVTPGRPLQSVPKYGDFGTAA